MYKIEYDIDFSELREFVNGVLEQIESGSNLINSIRAAGNYFVQSWIDTANQKFKHSAGGYARGIAEGVHYPFQSDPLTYQIEHTEDYATYLEKGFAGFDMKKMLFTSEKVRISKKGKRYIIIPFRHGTPGSKSLREMPESVYQEAKNLRKSVITGTYKEGSVRMAKDYEEAEYLKKHNQKKVLRRYYAWGGKLKGSGIYDGMVRFQSDMKQFNMGKFGAKTDGGNYSVYMTFRVMSEESTGWQHPGVKAMNILGETVKRERENVLRIIEEGIEKDLREIGVVD